MTGYIFRKEKNTKTTTSHHISCLKQCRENLEIFTVVEKHLFEGKKFP